MKRLAKFIRLTKFERRLFLEAVLWIGVAKLAVLSLPFRRLAPYLGRHMAESSEAAIPCHEKLLKQIAWALRTAAHHTPWKSQCLARCIAGKIMLKRRGLSSTLYLGLAKSDGRELIAHAWLRCGDKILTGLRGMRRFNVISTFAD